MAGAGALVQHGAVRADEGEVVAALAEGQPQVAEAREPDLAVGHRRRREHVLAAPAGPDDEGADAGVARRAVGQLRGEPLVVVLVAGQDQLGAVVQERLPEGSGAGVVPVVVARGEQRVVPEPDRARAGRGGEVGPEPLLLGAPDVAPDPGAVGVEDDDVPGRSQVEAVPALAGGAGRGAEVREVPRRALGHVLVVADRRTGDGLETAVGQLVGRGEVLEAAGHVLQVAEGEELREVGLAEHGVGDRGGVALGGRDRISEGAGHVTGRGDDDRRRRGGRVHRGVGHGAAVDRGRVARRRRDTRAVDERRRGVDKSVSCCSVNDRCLGAGRWHRFSAARVEQR